MQVLKNNYYVYILKCSDNTLYTGYTTDLDKRIKIHNKGKGAKYTRGRIPLKLIWSIKNSTLTKALKEESRIKKLSKKQKLLLVQTK